MDWIANINWWVMGAFGVVCCLTTWACTRLTRGGGSTGTPHWDEATQDRNDYGRLSLVAPPCEHHSKVIVGELTLCVHCGRGL